MEKQELYDMFKTVINLNRQRYIIIKDEIEVIIQNHLKNESKK